MKRAISILTIIILAMLFAGAAGAMVPLKIISKPVSTVLQQPQQDAQEAAQQVQKMQEPDNAPADTMILKSAPLLILRTDAQKETQKEEPSYSKESGNDAYSINTDMYAEKKIEPLSNQIGVDIKSLRYAGDFWRVWDEASTELHIEEMTVSGDTTVNDTFTITLTATDSDDLVTRISLGRSPYGPTDFDIRDCDPAAHSCTISFDLSEASPGIYTYRIKAKNERNHITNDAITVTVTERATTSFFNFRTAAMDGEDWSRGIIDYVDSEITVSGGEATPLTLSGRPFATFGLPSNMLWAFDYEADGYRHDTDLFYLDSRLPSCSGPSCEFTADVGGVEYVTSCDIVLSDLHYFCTLTNDEGYTISFDYRAVGDPVGPNTIQRHNLIYPTSAPRVSFGRLDVSFTEGGMFILPLDDYLEDDDTSPTDITWTVSRNSNIAVTIDPETPHDAIISQADPDWIGAETIEFRAADPEGNSGSDLITVQVFDDGNDPPVIVSKNPDSDTVNVGLASTRLFSIDARDPDYDLITVTWRKDGAEVATGTFSYLYEDTDRVAHPLTATVSDGIEEVSASWDIMLVEPIGDIEGTVTDYTTGAPLPDVEIELFDEGSTILVEETATDVFGQYAMTDVDEGTYDIRFTKEGYETLLIPSITVYPGETTTHNARLRTLPSTIGTLQGTVRNAAGMTPLGGVLVEVFSGTTLVNSTTTDTTGHYDMQLEEGTYIVRFSKIGYEVYEAPGILIIGEEITLLNANLEVTAEVIGTIEGTVTGSGGGAVSGALVEVFSGMTLINSTLTDLSGDYSMSIVGGVYDITVSRDGYRTETSSGVMVPAGATTTRDFSLEKWWDDNYGVKYELTVRSDASWSRNPLTRILLTPTEVDFADFQSDCGDLRVLNAAEDDLVDFYLETCSPTLTVIYIDANVDPLTDQTYYVYGNSTVPATTTSTVMDVRSYLDNLWGYWEMDETSDTSDALAAHGSDLALVTSPPGEAVTLETGRYDGARGEISPTKWFVNDTGIGTWNSNQNATILCWSKITDRAGNNPYYMSIYRSPWSVSGAFGMMSYYDNLNNRAACLLETQGTFATESHSNVNVPENTWHMSSCVFDTTANQHFMCVNNTCGTSEPFGYAGLPSSTEVSIGWADYNGDGLPESGQGSSFTDECGVWRGKAFSTADVDWFYNSGLGRKYPFHYSMPDYVLGPAIR